MGDRVLEALGTHAPSLLATADRHSLCADDAQDAYQRCAEAFLRRAGAIEIDEAGKWLHTVIKREALAIRERRLREVGSREFAFEAGAAARAVADAGPSAHDRAERLARLSLAAEALARLEPQELRALRLRAEGHTVDEIARVTGWSPRKAARHVSRGRRAFRDRVAAIDSGAECARWDGALAAIADGAAGPRELSAVRPHLRNCPACRATLRAYREAPASVAALVPPSALAALSGPDSGSWLHRLWSSPPAASTNAPRCRRSGFRRAPRP